MRSDGEGVLYGQAPNYWEGLQRALDIKGSVPNHLAPNVELGLQLGDLTLREYAWLRRERLWGTASEVAAVVGQNSYIEFLNPLGSQQLCIIEKLQLFTSANAIINVWQDTSGYGATRTTRVAALDGRMILGATAGVNPTVVVNVGTTAAPGIPLVTMQSRSTSSSFTPVSDPLTAIIVPPGTRLACTVNAVNIGLLWEAQWRERDMTVSELL